MSLLVAAPRPTSLTESAYEKIRGAILDGEVSPGERLSVVAVAQTLKMSRSPVRAAMERIASEGLLEDLGNGLVVAELAPDALFDAMEVYQRRDADGVFVHNLTLICDPDLSGGKYQQKTHLL